MTGLPPDAALSVRAHAAADLLADLQTPLLDQLVADPCDPARWVLACTDPSLSSGEATAVRWLSRLVWPGAEWLPDTTYEQVADRCDRDLAVRLARLGHGLTSLLAEEAT